MRKREFSVQELEELDIPYSAIANWHLGSTHWTEIRECVFEADDTYWLVTYEQGLTEYQDCDTWGDEETVQAVEVEEQQTTILKWVPVEN